MSVIIIKVSQLIICRSCYRAFIYFLSKYNPALTNFFYEEKHIRN